MKKIVSILEKFIKTYKHRYRLMEYRNQYPGENKINILPEHREFSSNRSFIKGDYIHLDGNLCKINTIEYNPVKDITYIYVEVERKLGVEDEMGCSDAYLRMVVKHNWDAVGNMDDNLKKVFDVLRKSSLLLSDDFEECKPLLIKYIYG